MCLNITKRKHFGHKNKQTLRDYVLDNIDSKTDKFKQITPKKAHNLFAKLSLTLKPQKLFDIQKSLIILTLLKHCPNKDSIPYVTYKLGNTLGNNILNYKQICGKFNLH